MSRSTRIVVAIVCAVIVVIVLIAELWLDTLLAKPARRFIERELSAATGLEAKIGGDFDLDLVPELNIVATQLAFTAEGQSDPTFTIEDIELDLHPWLLLSGAVVIDELQLSGALLNLRSTGDVPELDIGSLIESSDDEADVDIDFRIERIEIDDFQIKYEEPEGVTTPVMVIDEILLAKNESEEEVSLSIIGSFRENPFDIRGRVDIAPDLLRPSAPYPVTLQIRLPDVNVEGVGHLAQPTQLSRAEIDLSFDAQARDLALVGETFALEWPLPPIGPVVAQGRLRGPLGALGVEDLMMRVGDRDATWLEIEGSLKDLANFKDIHLIAQFGASDFRHLRPMVEHSPPDVGPFRGDAILSDADGYLGIEAVRLTGGDAGVFKLSLSAGIDDLREIDEISFHAEIEAGNLETVGALFGVELPATGPLSFTGHMTGSDEEVSAHGDMHFAESEFVGTASASFVPGTQPSLHARITSPHLRLYHIGFTPEDSAFEPKTAEEDGWGSWWSGSDPLPFEDLRAIDADIEFDADRVTGSEDLDAVDVEITVQLNDGHLVIRHSGDSSDGGSIRTRLQIDARKPDPTVSLWIDADALNLARMSKELTKDAQSEGLLDASIALESRGHSPTELRSNLAGSIRLVGRDGVIASKFGDMFAKNVLRLSLPALLSSKPADLGCVVANLEVARGVAVAKTLVVDSKRVVVVGTGKIDIGADAFDLVLSPKARNPGLVNLSAEVEVTGPIAKPVFRARSLTIPGRLVRGLIANLFAPMGAAVSPLRKKVDQLCEEGLPPETPPM